MRTIRINSVILAASTLTKIGQIPAKCSTAKLDTYINNPTAADATVRIAVSTSDSTPTSGEYIEYGTIIKASGGILTISDLTCCPGEYIYVYSSAAIGVRATAVTS